MTIEQQVFELTERVEDLVTGLREHARQHFVLERELEEAKLELRCLRIQERVQIEAQIKAAKEVAV